MLVKITTHEGVSSKDAVGSQGFACFLQDHPGSPGVQGIGTVGKNLSCSSVSPGFVSRQSARCNVYNHKLFCMPINLQEKRLLTSWPFKIPAVIHPVLPQVSWPTRH